MDHKENPIASWSQATNSNILEGLGWNWKRRNLKFTSPRGVILPGGAFRQRLQTRPIQLAGERQACFTVSGFYNVREEGT